MNNGLTENSFRKLKEEVTSLKNEISLISKSLQEIRTALLGNEFNEGGWLSRIRELEIEQAKLKQFKWTLLGAAAAIGGVFGFVTNILTRLI